MSGEYRVVLSSVVTLEDPKGTYEPREGHTKHGYIIHTFFLKGNIINMYQSMPLNQVSSYHLSGN